MSVVIATQLPVDPLAIQPPTMAATAPAPVAHDLSLGTASQNISIDTNASKVSSSATGRSPPSSPSSHTVVPAYPYSCVQPRSSALSSYSVAMSYIPGSTSNVTGYFSTHSGPHERLPDDSDVQTRLPSICVDYLSHDWSEDDVWTSWKAMTKHKAEIANGVRLENASWRTWAKQRSKLRTISPETLNCDVTWLYGPLHTAADPVPPPKLASLQDRLGIDSQARKPRTTTGSTDSPAEVKKPTETSKRSRPIRKPSKPILKHRSLSDILSVPPNLGRQGPIDLYTSDSDSQTPDEGVRQRSSDPGIRSGAASPSYFSIKPQHGSEDGTDAHGSDDMRTPMTANSEASQDFFAASHKRHISFNHRVEQCIAVDEEDEDWPQTAKPGRKRVGIIAAEENSDEENSDEDEVLTFRSSPRSQTIALAKSTPLPHREPHTIAKLAPTVLKSVEVWPSPSPVVVYDAPVRDESDQTEPSASSNAQKPSHQSKPATNEPQTSASWGQGGDEDFTATGYDYYEHDTPDTLGVVNGAASGSGSSSSTASPALSRDNSYTQGLREPPASSAQPGKSILKARPQSRTLDESPVSSTSSSAPSTPQSASPPAASTSFAISSSPSSSSAALTAAHLGYPEPNRGRSISRGSSSSSLEGRAASNDRRSSPVVVSPAEPPRERGRSQRWANSGSSDSINSISRAPALPDIGEGEDTPRTSPAKATIPLPDSDSRRSQLSRSPRKSYSNTSLGDMADLPDDDVQRKLGFESPVMPSSPTLRAQTAWTDESAARRSLLRARERSDAALRQAGDKPNPRRGSNDSSRGSTHSAAADDYGFAYGYDDEESGVVGRAVEIAATARDLVGALFNVGVSMVWRRG